MAGEYGPQGVGKPASWRTPKNVKNRSGKWGKNGDCVPITVPSKIMDR